MLFRSLKAPLVAPVTVMSLAAKVAGSTLKASVSAVVVAVFDTPPTCVALTNVTGVKVIAGGDGGAA